MDALVGEVVVVVIFLGCFVVSVSAQERACAKHGTPTVGCVRLRVSAWPALAKRLVLVFASCCFI